MFWPCLLLQCVVSVELSGWKWLIFFKFKTKHFYIFSFEHPFHFQQLWIKRIKKDYSRAERYKGQCLSRQTRGVGPMLGWSWASVGDDGPTSAQHWASAPCLLGMYICVSSFSLSSPRTFPRMPPGTVSHSHYLKTNWSFYIIDSHRNNQLNA